MKPIEDKERSKENTMAPNLKELKKLGKEMEQMKTNKQLKKEDWIPSPKQDEA